MGSPELSSKLNSKLNPTLNLEMSYYSLCGDCDGSVQDTCSADGIVYHCVHCIHLVVKDIHAKPVPIQDVITNPGAISWDGVTAEEALLDPHSPHAERIRNADTTYPIVATKIGGRFVILDGCHRSVKLLLEGAEYIYVVEVDVRMLPVFSVTN